jgi:excinuclease UvrABC ATPase subunit
MIDFQFSNCGKWAEGQWRFIESLSTYARLFLKKLDRPNVDEISYSLIHHSAYY